MRCRPSTLNEWKCYIPCLINGVCKFGSGNIFVASWFVIYYHKFFIAFIKYSIGCFRLRWPLTKLDRLDTDNKLQAHQQAAKKKLVHLRRVTQFNQLVRNLENRNAALIFFFSLSMSKVETPPRKSAVIIGLFWSKTADSKSDEPPIGRERNCVLHLKREKESIFVFF